MSLYLALQTVENNKNKKTVKFQGDMLNVLDFIQVYVFSSNHHLKKFMKYRKVHLCTEEFGQLCNVIRVFHIVRTCLVSPFRLHAT